MSELSGYTCDYCERKIVGDGIWIRSLITDDFVIGKSGKTGKRFDRLDFCSTDHLVKFIDEKL